jgi:16S rRNA (guanine966-N2)-methyltransferase
MTAPDLDRKECPGRNPETSNRMATRIIGGRAKGRRLVAPKGHAVRPTAARVKESLFNILPHDFSDITVLDLFAGTGNVSIEALSRGAAAAVLVEASARSAAAIRENLLRLGLGGRAQLWVMPAARALRSLARRGATFDFIFLDPPYDQGLVAPSLRLIDSGHLLQESGILVAEHGARETLNPRYGALVLNDRRQYGDTRLSFFKREAKTEHSI